MTILGWFSIANRCFGWNGKREIEDEYERKCTDYNTTLDLCALSIVRSLAKLSFTATMFSFCVLILLATWECERKIVNVVHRLHCKRARERVRDE